MCVCVCSCAPVRKRWCVGGSGGHLSATSVQTRTHTRRLATVARTNVFLVHLRLNVQRPDDRLAHTELFVCSEAFFLASFSLFCGLLNLNEFVLLLVSACK